MRSIPHTRWMLTLLIAAELACTPGPRPGAGPDAPMGASPMTAATPGSPDDPGTPPALPDGPGATPTPPTPATPAAPALIPKDPLGRDLAQGKIDTKTYYYTRLLLGFLPELAPSAYRPADGRPAFDVGALLYARANLASYTAEEQQVIRAFTSAPGTPAFWNLPAGLVRNLAPGGAGECLKEYARDALVDGTVDTVVKDIVKTKHFVFRMVRLKSSLPGDTEDRVKKALAAPVPDVGGVKPEVALSDYLDHTYEYFVKSVKGTTMLDPHDQLPFIPKDGLIPIYIPVCKTGTAHHNPCASPDGWIFSGVEYGLELAALRRVVLPHELFHVLEYVYWGDTTAPDSDWPFEAAAVAAENLVAPDVRRWNGGKEDGGGPLDRAFKCPEEPLHTTLRGECAVTKQHPARLYQGDYSKWTFFEYFLRAPDLRPGRMGFFFISFKDAGGSAPKTLKKMFWQSQLPYYHAALVGVVAGRPDPFAAIRPHVGKSGSADYAPDWPDRYTYRLRADFVKGTTKSWRFTPTEALDQFTPNRLSGARVEPGAAHRILIEIPPDTPAGDELLGLVIRPSDPNLIGATYAVDGASPFQPSMQNLTIIRGPGSVVIGKTQMIDSVPGTVGGKKPAFVLIVLTNITDQPITYDLGITFSERCIQECAKHYSQNLQHCITPWCTDPRDGKVGQECVNATRADFEKALGGTGGSKLSPMRGGTFCYFACRNSVSNSQLHEPYMDTPGNAWKRKISGGDNGPAGLVPLTSWPALECRDIMKSGTIK